MKATRWENPLKKKGLKDVQEILEHDQVNDSDWYRRPFDA